MNVVEARAQIIDVLVAVEVLTHRQGQYLLEGPAEDVKLAELGIDSVKIIDLCVGLEERVGREISIEELIENPTVNKLAGHLAEACT